MINYTEVSSIIFPLQIIKTRLSNVHQASLRFWRISLKPVLRIRFETKDIGTFFQYFFFFKISYFKQFQLLSLFKNTLFKSKTNVMFFHHHHWCSALKQVIGIQFLQLSLFKALRLIISYVPLVLMPSSNMILPFYLSFNDCFLDLFTEEPNYIYEAKKESGAQSGLGSIRPFHTAFSQGMSKQIRYLQQ